LAFVDFLESDLSSNMAVVILHKGDIVFEHYARMQEYEKPIWWSVTKVFASTLIARLEDRGQIDTNKPVDFYLPELQGSDFKGVTVRNVLDMASGIDCSDGNYARGTCYYEYEASLNDAVRSNNTASTPYEALANMKPGRWADQGVGFDYSGANTFVLSWIVERLMAMPFQDAVTKELWHKMGAEGDASIFAARYGIALSSGGFLAKARDMARFGLLFTPSYKKVSSEKVISDRYLDMIINKGRPELLANARFVDEDSADPEIKHNSYQWDVVYNNNDIYKGGWAGQGLLINHERDLVAVYLGYIKEDGSELAVLPRLRELLKTIYPK
jgi:CubicO group peptidase (beta-lactamase class C family)